MNTNDIQKFYGSKAKALVAIGVSRQAWERWEKTGVPLDRQLALQIETSKTGAPLILSERKGVDNEKSGKRRNP